MLHNIYPCKVKYTSLTMKDPPPDEGGADETVVDLPGCRGVPVPVGPALSTHT